MSNLHTISIVIPHYNDFERLYQCVESIFDCFSVGCRPEIFIVDNNSDNKNKLDELNVYCTRHCQLNLLHESKPGSYYARNLALKEIFGKSDYVYFTDSDCIVTTNWVDFIKNNKVLLNEGRTIFAGDVEIPCKSGSFSECYDSVFAFPQRYYVEKLNFGVTANLLIPSSVFDEIGEFNTDSFSGGDKEFCNRAYRSGYLIAYIESLSVKHPPRGSIKDLLMKNIRTKRGHLQRELNEFGFLKRFILSLLRFIPRFDILLIRFSEQRVEKKSLKKFLKVSVVFLLLQLCVSLYEIIYFFKIDPLRPR